MYDLSSKCQDLERKLTEYEGYEVEKANLLGKLYEKEKIIQTGKAVTDVLTKLMLKELTKMDYISCELIKSGGYGVIFKIFSLTKGTNILKLDFKDE